MLNLSLCFSINLAPKDLFLETIVVPTLLNNIVELLNNSERLEDMGRNSLIASGYAQQRADEASINLIELLKTYRKINVA